MGCKQMRTNANKCRQTSTNASNRRGERRKQTQANASNVDKRKQTLAPPFSAVFPTALCNPLTYFHGTVLGFGWQHFLGSIFTCFFSPTSYALPRKETAPSTPVSIPPRFSASCKPTRFATPLPAMSKSSPEGCEFAPVWNSQKRAYTMRPSRGVNCACFVARAWRCGRYGAL